MCGHVGALLKASVWSQTANCSGELLETANEQTIIHHPIEQRSGKEERKEGRILTREEASLSCPSVFETSLF